MTLRHFIALGFVGLVVVFVIQNMEVVQVAFLIWRIEASRVIIYLTIFLIGVLCGWLGRSFRRS